MIRRRKVGLHGHMRTDVPKENYQESSAIFSFEFLGRTAVEHRSIYDVLGHFDGGGTLHRFLLGHIRIPICDDQEMIVLP